VSGFRAHQFAELSGVTVRALHHYDRLGLLKPLRTESGYRLYSARDLERLEQIVALKFLGLPLKQIKVLLDREAVALPEALRRQRKVLERKRKLLDNAITAIREAECVLKPGQPPDAAILKKLIEVIAMQDEAQNDMEWTSKYYSEEAKKKIEIRKAEWSPELQERVSKQWSELFHEVGNSLNEDPAGAHAQSLADRWTELVEEFTGGDRQITEGLKNLYADRANWPSDAPAQMHFNPELWTFISKAIAARQRK
jgi:DNA-binding transcriptional MerR regulator